MNPLEKLGWRQDWMADGECVGHPNTDLFFPEKPESQSTYQETRQICATCVVWKDCLRYALNINEQFGMWGGLSIVERRKIRNLDAVHKCEKCGLINVFNVKAQTICDRCQKHILRRQRRRGLVSQPT